MCPKNRGHRKTRSACRDTKGMEPISIDFTKKWAILLGTYTTGNLLVSVNSYPNDVNGLKSDLPPKALVECELHVDRGRYF